MTIARRALAYVAMWADVAAFRGADRHRLAQLTRMAIMRPNVALTAQTKQGGSPWAAHGQGCVSEMPEKVLIVEDEPSLVETLQYNLLRQGYTVSTARDGLAALAIARSERPQLIVLDIMLPGLDGLEVCRILRQEMGVPILVLTARAEEIDKVVGLELGADDYMTKPFSMRELLARVKALLRRARLTREQVAQEDREAQAEGAQPEDGRMVFGDLVVLPMRREVLRLARGAPSPQVLELRPKEYELFLFLARHRAIVLSRDLILERVWGWDYAGGSRTVDVHVRWLREKIEDDPANPSRIVTVRGIGYRFEG